MARQTTGARTIMARTKRVRKLQWHNRLLAVGWLLLALVLLLPFFSQATEMQFARSEKALEVMGKIIIQAEDRF